MGITYQGGCLCGNIRFTATGSPNKPYTCSCKLCQRHSGALTQVWVEFDREDVDWDGPGGEPKPGVLQIIHPEASAMSVVVHWALLMTNL